MHSRNQNPIQMRQGPCGKRPAGFSLMEVMLAITILGIGMATAAALFPTALQENRSANNNVLGNIIGQNGLAIARAKFAYPLKDSTNADVGTTLTDISGRLGVDGLYAPDASNKSRHGFLLLARRMPSNTDTKANQYQLVAFSYTKPGLDDVPAMFKSANVPAADKGDLSILTGDATAFKLGSPIVLEDATNPMSPRLLLSHIRTITGAGAIIDRVPGGITYNVWSVGGKDAGGKDFDVSPGTNITVSVSGLWR